jgi:DNA processing protein
MPNLIETVHEGTDERLSRLALTLLIEPGALIERYGATVTARIGLGIEDGHPADTETVNRFRHDLTPRVTSGTLNNALVTAERFGAKMLIPGNPEWPEAAADLRTRQPIALWTKGNADLLAAPLRRKCCHQSLLSNTPEGLRELMASTPWPTVQPLASGGATIATVASGIDRNYPPGHDALLQRIAEHGLILSELAPGTPPSSSNATASSPHSPTPPSW